MLLVLVVTVEVLIASEKVTDKLDVTSIQVALSAGFVDETVGAVVSIVIALLAPREPEAPGEGKVRVALLLALSRMVPPLADRELVAL